MITSYSPQRPGTVVATAPEAVAADVVGAAERARRAQQEWARAAAVERAAVLSAVADAVAAATAELTDLVIQEVGKPRGEAAGEVDRTQKLLRYYAQQVFDPVGALHEPAGSGLLYTRRRPVGIAGLIVPWNFPLAIPVWKLAPALAFGNAALLKPAPQALGCGQRLEELFRIHLPDKDLLTVLPGGPETGRVVTELSDAVSFTGSVTAGRAVIAVAGTEGNRVQAEMGGQNPAVVLPDADVGRAARVIAGAAMTFAGQKCTATRRVVLVGDRRDFREALVSAVDELVVGDPEDHATSVGPVVDDVARDRVLDAVAAARHGGARVLSGGGTVDRPGPYVAPTVLEGLDEAHPVAREEVFGPVLLLQYADSPDHAVRIANGTQLGLAASVHTNDLSAALSIADRLEAGQVRVNAATTGAAFHVPFGGTKRSSHGGREQGKAAQDFFTTMQTVAVDGMS